MDFIHPLTLQSGSIPGNVFLAPLAGYSDKAFRRLCREFGAYMCFTEMVSCEGFSRNGPRTTAIAEPYAHEQPYAVQIFGSNPRTTARAVSLLEKYNPALIDLNCGCPVPKVIKSGAGAALMKDPEKIGEIVKAMLDNTDSAVSVKLRSGWDQSSLVYLQAAEKAQAAGASLITLHARTRKQGFKGQSIRDHIKELKKHVSLPVIASGDIFKADDALSVMRETGCDGVMVARGCFGNPFIFKQIIELNHTGQLSGIPERNEKIGTALRHLVLCREYYGDNYTAKEMKKHLARYCRNFDDASSLRDVLMRAGTSWEQEAQLKKHLEQDQHSP